ncbi:protein ARV 2 isoform X3 [Arachis hypogaea]|uniref:protein ARV 2 isoform X3 n=3 Tax=Arachis TaxID=3817 RepID=UPI003B21CEAF
MVSDISLYTTGFEVQIFIPSFLVFYMIGARIALFFFPFVFIYLFDFFFQILMIDLMLHKQKAYRHLLYNVLNQQTLKFEGLHWKLAIIYFIFDACIHLYVEARNSSSLVSTCCKVFMYVVFGNFMFLLTFFIMFKIFLNASINISRFNDLLLTIMISCYFKIFLIAMMVWEFPNSVIFIIELFCLSSNAVALNVMTESSMGRCVWACFGAYAVKLFVTQVLDLRFLEQLIKGWIQMSSSS